MNYIDPLTEELSVTYNDITYTTEYFKPATTISGVTDESHGDWSVGTTYATGDYVIVPELKRIYRSASDSNVGNFPLANTDLWVDYGSINSYNMFASDEDIGSVTSGTDGFLEFDFSKCNTIAGLDLDFFVSNVMLIRTDSITYKSTYASGTTYDLDDRIFYENKLYKSLQGSNTGNQPDISATYWEEDTDNVYFNDEILGSDIGCSTYGEYFYTSVNRLTRKILTDLEWLPSSILRIDFEGAWSIGTICYNTIQDFGATLVTSSVKYQSNSKISTNEFTGYRTIIRLGKIRLLTCDVIRDSELFGDTLQKADKLIDKNIIWIPSSDDKFTEAVSIGYIEDLSVPMNNSSKFKTQLKIVGVSK